ncbi:lipopolysaccharide biosynthesis protein [Anthocerotibacter panamensis]|uniref:lipopolysaccharide biosynthesis protein n=1 Tax=Anthocerotibacter panamensis TaxID=2857077 RepID=UPI001C40728E|nr:lipopolysaccharide biosynthesis protein [Anthocerotibacter panamensis]
MPDDTPPPSINAPKAQTLRSQTVAGVRWAGSFQALQQTLNLGASMVMARLLLPEDYGLVAMVSVFTGIVFFVLDLGLGVALVQSRHLTQRQISSTFWLNTGLGLGLTVLGLGLSWPLALLYHTPQVQVVAMVMSCNFFLSALGATQRTLLTRQMRFRTLEFCSLVGEVTAIAVAIALAMAGAGLWSLVARMGVSIGLRTILPWGASAWRPSWEFSWAEVRVFFGFGRDVLFGRMLGHIARNSDNFLIGRFINATQLGYYTLAYNLMSLPLQRFVYMLSEVLFPALSRLQEDPARLCAVWFRGSRLIMAVTTPLLVGLMVLAPPLVQVVYGERWLPAVPVLRILACCGAIQVFDALNAPVLMALNRTRLMMKLTLVNTVAAVCSFLVGLPVGILGVAACFTGVTLITTRYGLKRTLGCLGLGLEHLWLNLRGVMGATGGMGLVLWMLVAWAPLSDALLLGVGIPLGMGLYLLLLGWLAPVVLREALEVLPEGLVKRWQGLWARA